MPWPDPVDKTQAFFWRVRYSRPTMSSRPSHAVTGADRRLARHLALAIVLKLLVLLLLWQVFIRGQRVDVDSQRMADIVAPAAASSSAVTQEVPRDQ